MSQGRVGWSRGRGFSVAVAVTSWCTLFAWAGFVERPAGYLGPLLAVALLVGGVGALGRWARLPGAVIVLIQVVVTGLHLNRIWAGELSLGGLVPTKASTVEIAAQLRDSVAAAQEYAAPVPATVDEIYPLLILAGTGCILLVDVLAATLRRVPLAGLPLLLIYSLPLSILGEGVSWWVFVFSAAGFLTMLALQESDRLAHWGRASGESDTGSGSGSSGLKDGSQGRMAVFIGTVTMSCALLLPALVPSVDLDWFGDGSGTGAGGDSVNIGSPMADLRRDLLRGEDVPVAYLVTPEPNPAYLRISVLDEYDGTVWRPGDRDIPAEQNTRRRLPPPIGLAPGIERTEVPYSIRTTDDFNSLWLPAPYPLISIDAAGDWRYDLRTLDFVSADDDVRADNFAYDLTALRLQVEAADLAETSSPRESIAVPNTDLPADTPDLVGDLALEVTEGTSNDLEKAVALQSWFREDGGFTYSTERILGSGNSDLESFLTDGALGRTGYCEQFAAAMATMGRSLDIPSRVVVGFLRPEQIAPEQWVYSSHDLHAWPEMYFEGVGWVRFEPTPQARAPRVPGYAANLPVIGEDPGDQPSDGASQEPVTPPRADERFPEQNPDAAAERDQGNRGVAPLLGWTGGTALVILLSALPRFLRRLRRRRRWTVTGHQASAEAAWEELGDTAVDLGLPWPRGRSPRETADLIVGGFATPDAGTDFGADTGADDGSPVRPRRGRAANPEASRALDRLVVTVERARYARPEGAEQSAPAPQRLHNDVNRCAEAMYAGVSRRRSLRAEWLPRSLVRRNRAAEPRDRDEPTPTRSDEFVDHLS